MTHDETMTREALARLTRAETEGLLDFTDARGGCEPVAVRNGSPYYRNYVRVDGPETLYSDLELTLLLRLTQWVNALEAPMQMNHALRAFDDGCAFWRICKFMEPQRGTTLVWYGTRANWRRGDSCRTLAELLGTIYRADLRDGMWMCYGDLIPQAVQAGQSYETTYRGIAFGGAAFTYQQLALFAPTRGELEELIGVFRDERAAQGEPYEALDRSRPYAGLRKQLGGG